MVNLSKLEEIKDLRTIWPHEAHDFTPWLAEEDNISLLSEAVGIEISVDETESSVGNFNVDIFATEIGTERKIIIENQLEDTNHDHLGKLITYASGKSADVIIWVVKNAREEHRAAIEWLNNHTDDEIGFFLCEIKLFRIGNSDPAVKFEVIEKPNDWTKVIKKNNNLNENQQFHYEYWESFNNYAFNNPDFSKNFNKRKASKNHWMSFSIGSSACGLGVLLVQKRSELNVELYISDDADLYQHLFENRKEIEQKTGLTFDWRELPNRKASRIILVNTADIKNRNEWQTQFDWIMDVLMRMKKVFKKYI